MLLKVLYKEKDKYIVRYINSLREIEMTKEELLKYIADGIVINAKASKNGRITFKDRVYSYKYETELMLNIECKDTKYKYALDKVEIQMENIKDRNDIHLVLTGDTEQQIAEWKVIDRKTGIKMPGSIITTPDRLAEILYNECDKLDKLLGKR